MSVIALNWELGADLGHISRFRIVASHLREQGHRPICLLRDISRAEEILGGPGIEYLQAPIWLPKTQGLPSEANFTETILRFGFLNPEGLTAMVQAWRRLWSYIGAESLIMDLAPTACLAARDFGLPRMLLGNSYAIPPLTKPLPPFRSLSNTDKEIPRLLDTEQKVLSNINTVAMNLGITPLRSVSDLFATEERMCCGIPALDVYGERADTTYISPINATDMGAPPRWPNTPKPRIFAYLKPHFGHFEAVMNTLLQTDANILVFSPGISEATLRKFSRPNVLISTIPFRMADVARSCNLIVCHAGGTADIALLAGKPVLLLPTQMEQLMTSQRVATLGAGLFLPVNGNPGELKRLIKRLLNEGEFTAAAQQFATRYANQPDPLITLSNLVNCCTSDKTVMQ